MENTQSVWKGTHPEQHTWAQPCPCPCPCAEHVPSSTAGTQTAPKALDVAELALQQALGAGISSSRAWQCREGNGAGAGLTGALRIHLQQPLELLCVLHSKGGTACPGGPAVFPACRAQAVCVFQGLMCCTDRGGCALAKLRCWGALKLLSETHRCLCALLCHERRAGNQ